MTKQDFELIARTIRDMPVTISLSDVEDAFRRALEKRYPNFNPDKFREFIYR